MSSYTMTLREYIEMWTQDTDSMSVRDRIETGRSKLFDFDYPIFDPAYKQEFETHFIRNFYMREIGAETEGLFKFNLETWLLIHMPYYNKLFESELLSYDPLSNTKLDSTSNKKNNLTGNASNNQNVQHDSTTGNDTTENVTESGFSRNLESNNPDTRLQLTATDGVGVIQYASEITEDKMTGNKSVTNHSGGNNSATESQTGTSTSQVDSSENAADHTEGKTGSQSFAQLLKEHRETFLRIEKQLFYEMNQLFMLTY